MDPSSSKTVLFEQLARFDKALANPVRLRLLDLLVQREYGVEELAEAAGMRLGNTSAQLKVLTSVGLLATRRSGTHVYYRAADDDVAALVAFMKQFAASRLAQADPDAAGSAESGLEGP